MAESSLQTVDRALVILEMLAKEGLTAKEIEERLGLNKTTVHRLLITLLNRGFVERNEATGIYQIGIRLVEISSIRLNHVELKTEALPYLHQLANKVQQSVQLAIYDEGEAVFIEKVEKYMSIRMYCQIGKRIPLYCSAVGKVLISDHDDKEIIEILSKEPYEKFTPTTFGTPEEVLKDIKRARKEGFARDSAEHEEGVYCVAMPIYDYRGRVVASVSITGFDENIFEEEGTEKRELLQSTCQEISKCLGYNKKI